MLVLKRERERERERERFRAPPTERFLVHLAYCLSRCANRCQKLAKYVQIVVGAFMRLLLILQTTQVPSPSFSCTLREVLSLINRIRILSLHPSSFTFHCSLRYTLCIADKVSGAKSTIEYLLISNAILTQKVLKCDIDVHDMMQCGSVS